MNQVDTAIVERQANSVRFRWHELLLRDPEVRRRPNALALAGHIMHRYSGPKGFAEVSIGSAAKALNANSRSIERSFAFLITRGWLQLKERYTIAGRRWSANRYSLSFGPDDLDPDMHHESEIHD